MAILMACASPLSTNEARPLHAPCVVGQAVVKDEMNDLSGSA
jgi:hypothetical protein